MGHKIEKLKTLGRLGPTNILRVAAYRACLKIPQSKIRKVVDAGGTASGPFFRITQTENAANQAILLPKLFGFHDIGETDSPPSWLTNPLNGQTFPSGTRPFYAIPDFDPDVGDIKQLWELSRFQWVLTMAQDGKENPQQVSNLNSWVEDWVKVNPAYQGPNWKCGQEASLRVLHLIMGAYLLGEIQTPLTGLQDLIYLHLNRIAPTTSYAKAQDNNHGTSEAAALYIGGSWLASLGRSEGTAWARKGRRLLENRVAHLINEDGSFSQYSVTYHRMMLDSLSLCEWWRGRIDDTPFSLAFRKKAKAASEWLFRLVDPLSGDAPNLGANDGAHILNFAAVDYRDFRPSTALAFAIWHGQSAFAENKGVQDQLRAIEVEQPKEIAASAKSDAGLNGGFSVLKTPSDLVVLRCPRFTFRPSQSDILHLDFWRDGENIFRDGGTYSYNSTEEDLDYFGGVRSHNTVEFDGRDQMPRLGRFLFGAWPKTSDFEFNNAKVMSGYKDFKGAYHKRLVKLTETMLSVRDDVSGFEKSAVLRWRISPNLITETPEIKKTALGFLIDLGAYELEISGPSSMRASWEIGAQSLYYLHKSPLSVLVITVHEASAIETQLRWAK